MLIRYLLVCLWTVQLCAYDLLRFTACEGGTLGNDFEHVLTGIETYILGRTGLSGIPKKRSYDALLVVGGHGDYDALFENGCTRIVIATAVQKLVQRGISCSCIIIDVCVGAALADLFLPLLAHNGKLVARMYSGDAALTYTFMQRIYVGSPSKRSVYAVVLDALTVVDVANRDDFVETFFDTLASMDDSGSVCAQLAQFKNALRMSKTDSAAWDRSAAQFIAALQDNNGNVFADARARLVRIITVYIPLISAYGIYDKMGTSMRYDKRLDTFGRFVQLFNGDEAGADTMFTEKNTILTEKNIVCARMHTHIPGIRIVAI